MQAYPAEMMETLWALHFSAARFLFLDSDTAFLVRTILSAIFEENGIQSLLSNFILLFKALFLCLVNQIKQIQSVDYAPLVGMIPLSAFKTEHKLTMLAFTIVFLPFDSSQRPTTLQRAPPEVVHLSDSIIKRKLLIFFELSLIEADVSNVQVIQMFSAG